MRNAQNFNIASDKRWVNTMGALNGARRELETLAPHPHRPAQKALPACDNSQTAKAAVRDDGACLAMLLIAAFTGAHFGPMAGHAVTAIDVYDAWQHDRRNVVERPAETGESNRGIQLGEKNAIGLGFNRNARPEQPGAWDAYMADLPQRRVLEQSIGALYREAEQREKAQTAWMQKLAR